MSCTPELFRHAVETFNAGDFHSAHEAWEELWNEAIGEEKRALQGLVQIAAGYMKAEIGEVRGALRLLTRGRALLENCAAAVPDLPAAVLLGAVQADVVRLQGGATPLRPPRL